MPLKVLLADDSAAIKKVVQLSLQDYGVELRTINSGKDVVEVARSFQPDITFVDVLLPHRSGYEIATDLKSDPSLKQTPVVMLWSSFMAFDEGKFKSSGAEERLEKPFEAGTLRSFVQKLVPKTQTNPVSKHVDLPKMEFEGMTRSVSQTRIDIPPAEAPAASTTPGWNMSSFEEMPIPGGESPAETPTTNWGSDSEWIKKDISKFTVNIPDEFNEEPPAVPTPSAPVFAEAKVEAPVPVAPPPVPEVTSPSIRMAQDTFGSGTAIPSKTAVSQISDEEIRRIVTEEVKKIASQIAQDIVWKAVPEIATNLIKEEIKRLLEIEHS